VERQQTAHVTVPDGGADVVDRLALVLARHPGSDDVLLHFRVQGKEVTIQVGERFRVTAGPALKEDLDAQFGREVTRLETVRPRAAANGNARGNGRNGNGRADSG
jgi:hypothetical protein